MRAATEADLPAIAALWRALNDEASLAPYGPTTLEEIWPDGGSLLEEYLVLIADDGATCGCVLAGMARRDVGYVFGLYVRPAARRRGAGRELLRAVAGVLRERGARWVLLDVDRGNDGAEAFYDRLGFEQAGRRLTVDVDRLLD
jgi:ribosomal protein S18 acetylase RimI-like enzyme